MVAVGPAAVVTYTTSAKLGVVFPLLGVGMGHVARQRTAFPDLRIAGNAAATVYVRRPLMKQPALALSTVASVRAAVMDRDVEPVSVTAIVGCLENRALTAPRPPRVVLNKSANLCAEMGSVGQGRIATHVSMTVAALFAGRPVMVVCVCSQRASAMSAVAMGVGGVAGAV
jgi:hypothetical protein